MNEILQNLDWSVLTDLLLSAIPALVCITLHEFSHGYAAFLLGDDTAKRMGRLTLNPLRHIDVMGLVMLAFLHFGWAKPVPVDMKNFKRPKLGMAITALAGPLMNVIIACVALFLYGLFLPLLSLSNVGIYGLKMLYITASLSVSLAVFNLIPIPPLDGSKILFSVFTDRGYIWLMRYERYGMILLAVILLTGVISSPLYRVTEACLDFLMHLAGLGARLTGLLLRGGVAA